MERLTEIQKEQLAYGILELLQQYDLTGDVRIYFNNKCLTGDGEVLEDKKGSDYFKYATDETISMSFEGDLNGVLNYRHISLCNEFIPKFQALFDSYGLFFELGDTWNLGTAYTNEAPFEDAEEVIEGSNPTNPIYIKKGSCPAKLEPIRAEWEKRQNEYGNIGSCVVGAGFTFKFQEMHYRMPPQGRWQGSCSWEDSVETIRGMLHKAGCKNIIYHDGNMD